MVQDFTPEALTKFIEAESFPLITEMSKKDEMSAVEKFLEADNPKLLDSKQKTFRHMLSTQTKIGHEVTYIAKNVKSEQLAGKLTACIKSEHARSE